MLYVLLILLLSLASCLSDFDSFKTKFGRTYATPAEESRRRQIFSANMVRAAELTRLNPGASFGASKFSDLTRDEYLTHLNPPMTRRAPHGVSASHPSAPSSKDWCALGACSPVPNTGQCGSTWAVAAVMAIESAEYLKHHQMTLLSVQQIVSCDTEDYGCNGGFPEGAFKYVMSAGGLESAQDYPYTSGEGDVAPCQFDRSKVVASVKGWEWATQDNNEPRLVSFVAKTGPPLVCIDATAWQLYSGGVMTEAVCGNGTEINHCAQLVAFDTAQGAYNVENMWGSDWGENGFIRLQMNHNTCGITNYAQWPLVN